MIIPKTMPTIKKRLFIIKKYPLPVKKQMQQSGIWNKPLMEKLQ